MTTPGGTPPGWYDDGTGTQRWYDGTQWTEHVNVPPPPPPHGGPLAPGPTAKHGADAEARRPHPIAVAIAGVVLVVALVGIAVLASSSSSDSPSSAASPTPASTTPYSYDYNTMTPTAAASDDGTSEITPDPASADDSTDDEIVPEPEPVKAWHPKGYDLYADDIAVKWVAVSKLNCDAYTQCAAIYVKTENGCDDLYAEAKLLDSSGTVIGYTNDSIGSLDPKERARLDFEFYEDGVKNLRLAKVECY